jgi:anaerobic ribonucleoside-triphosphate reductase
MEPQIFVNENGVEVQRTPCEIYTRVMGYHRPVTNFNIGKKAEFYSRKYFKSTNCCFIAEYQ